MASISSSSFAKDVLADCLAGRKVTSARALRLADDECSPDFFRIVVEGLADRFDAALAIGYARLFAAAIGQPDLAARYERIRRPRLCRAEPRRVFVLSRVTLGADVAVTSVLLDAAKRRWPRADIVLVGPAKNAALFAEDRRILHREVTYRRGTLRERLAAWPALREALDVPESIVVDPDSRLTQLGLLPVCPEENYYFFESRGYGGESVAALPELAAQWAREVFGVAGARPYVAVPPAPGADVAVSLGVGENPAKRLPDPFEEKLLALLASTGRRILIDRGAGGEEAARVERAVQRSGARVEYWDGSFAGFASRIVSSRLYVGYDSAGQHVAAACGVPLVSVFAGFACPRMFHRWKPTGPGPITVIRAEPPDAAAALDQVRSALA